MIPFTRPAHLNAAMENIAHALAARKLCGDGPFCRKVENILEAGLGLPRALLTTSCTHALEMAGLLLDIHPGDEVIVPTFTFVSTISAFALRGATPIFCDIRNDTLNLDERLLPALINARTRAIVPVHYGGVGCNMDVICRLAQEHNIPVVEDNAHGLFGKYRGKWLGTFGALATQSFHDTKNFSCGEGGALLINDPTHLTRAEIIREKGTNRSKFFRGQVDKYTWVDHGSSYVLSDLLAAVLASQLDQRVHIQATRQRIWERYAQELQTWAAENGASLPVIPQECEHPYHVFYLRLPAQRRTAFIEHMRSHEIQTPFHYQPLHASPMGQQLGGKPGQCPVAERVADELVRLPLFNDMTNDEQSEVIATVRAFR